MNFAKWSEAVERRKTSLLPIIHNCLTLGKSFRQKVKELLKEKLEALLVFDEMFHGCRSRRES
jgi:glutamate-1-semialdehyde aminotransferase